jgi:hypothetical protein
MKFLRLLGIPPLFLLDQPKKESGGLRRSPQKAGLIEAAMRP